MVCGCVCDIPWRRHHQSIDRRAGKPINTILLWGFVLQALSCFLLKEGK
jgi:hypothetical protein